MSDVEMLKVTDLCIVFGILKVLQSHDVQARKGMRLLKTASNILFYEEMSWPILASHETAERQE